MGISRRNFLVGLSVASVGLLGYNMRGRLLGALPGNKLRSRYLAFVQHPNHAAKIGAVYRHKYPKDSSSERMLAKLSGYMQLDSSRPGKREIEQALLETVKADFAQGRTLNLDGWVVSRTEAVLAGLVFASRTD